MAFFGKFLRVVQNHMVITSEKMNHGLEYIRLPVNYFLKKFYDRHSPTVLSFCIVYPDGHHLGHLASTDNDTKF